MSRTLSGYEERPAQLDMADSVERALSDGRPLFVEAGTGTGKTLAYLVPAVLCGKTIVISTATRALQEQIFDKDLPLVAAALSPFGVTFEAALMKGLSNYLCKRRLHELFVTEASERDPVLARIARWADESTSGDRAELTDVAEDHAAWLKVQSSTETRIGSGCPFFDECFVTRMRQRADAAQLVVVNHHLFFADLALRAGREGYASAIPNYDAVIFDEAHQLEDIATDFFGVRVSSARIDALARDAARSFAAANLEDRRAGTGAQLLLDQVCEAARTFFDELARVGQVSRGAETRRTLGPEAFPPRVLALHGKLDACLEAIARHAETASRGGGARDREAVALVARRADDLRGVLADIVRGATSSARDARNGAHEPLRVAWVNLGERSISIGASPVELGGILRRALFDRVSCVVCTSATLATYAAGGPSFHFAKARLGAPPETEEVVVPSPFDFASRVLLYLPRDLPEPADPAFEDAATHRIAELVRVTGGGAFVLCTSTRAMHRLHAALGGRLHVAPMVQGQAPKHVLLSRFRAEENAVLVATMSFWEGVDVPGRALRLVVIDKIPFAVPTDPVVAARGAQIEREGGNAFSQYAVPAAAITLKQGFGRLVRTQRDAGIVAILDRRITSRGYGRALLASLPPARRVGQLEQVQGFWEQIGA